MFPFFLGCGKHREPLNQLVQIAEACARIQYQRIVIPADGPLEQTELAQLVFQQHREDFVLIATLPANDLSNDGTDQMARVAGQQGLVTTLVQRGRVVDGLPDQGRRRQFKNVPGLSRPDQCPQRAGEGSKGGRIGIEPHGQMQIGRTPDVFQRVTHAPDRLVQIRHQPLGDRLISCRVDERQLVLAACHPFTPEFFQRRCQKPSGIPAPIDRRLRQKDSVLRGVLHKGLIDGDNGFAEVGREHDVGGDLLGRTFLAGLGQYGRQ